MRVLPKSTVVSGAPRKPLENRFCGGLVVASAGTANPFMHQIKPSALA
jgi:hypothetical protein